MMYRVGIAGLLHETNTFSQTPTTMQDFIRLSGFYPEIRKGNELFKFKEGRINIATSGFLSAAEENGFEIVPLVWAGTEPSQPVSEEVFDSLMEMILSAMEKGKPYDGLFLDLHGAMVYGHLKNGETEILRRVRRVVGDIPIVVSFDLHGNISAESFALATAMIGYRTYPHVDGFENGERCARLLQTILQHKPFFGVFRQLPFLMPSTAQATTKEPAKSMYAFLEEVEKSEGVLSTTLMEGFPPSDMPDTGPSIFTYAVSRQLAEEAAERIYQYILARESRFTCDLLLWDDAVQKAIQLAHNNKGPVILADIQDNSGGGSPSDTVWLLESLVKRGAESAAIGLIYDPETAAEAHAAGEGAEIELSVGGKSLEGQKPFRGVFRVIKLHDGDFIGTGPMVKGRVLNLGKMAQLQIDDVRVAVSSDRMQALDQSLFKVVGIEPAEMKILALKSANHYRVDFGPIASAIINVEAPSAIIEDPSKIPYTNLREGVRLGGKGPAYHKS
jgi:microcystin degradation protein MlrC